MDSMTNESEDLTQEEAGCIQAIDRGAVHRICSGQVVLNLATAVKELVENSLDAGATQIDVRLKDYGSELLEVSDNGSGVEPKNFAGLTLKHHTSKLKDFSDLVSVDTFGFRGEALSSLCALSKLTVTTCHKSETVGHKLEYDHNGKLVAKTPTARQTGTTISLEQLFSTLPVRHKEFTRNLKKEFVKMTQVLNAYCLISTGVRLSCTNQVSKGKKTTILSTNGNNSVKENITNLFGAKQLNSVVEFQQVPPSEDVCSQYSIKVPEEDIQVFKIHGHVSSCEHGRGRSSTDRQFYFINKRPCDPVKISRVVNEVYHMYNRHQYPFVMLDISLDKECVDVNVTPDKRQIFLQEEKLLLSILKTSLMKVFDPLAATVQISNTSNIQTLFGRSQSSPAAGFANSPNLKQNSPLKKHSSCPSSYTPQASKPSLANLKRTFSSAFSSPSSCVDSSPKQPSSDQKDKQRRLDSFVNRTSLGSYSPSPTRQFNTQSDSFTVTEIKLSDITKDTDTSLADKEGTDDKDINNCLKKSSDDQTDCTNGLSKSMVVTNDSGDSAFSSSQGSSSVVSVISTESDFKDDKTHHNLHEPTNLSNVQTDLVGDKDVADIEPSNFQQNLEENCDNCGQVNDEAIIPAAKQTLESITLTEFDELEGTQSKPSATVSFSMSSLKEKFKHRTKRRADSKTVGFHAKITPGDSQAAEDELKKEIKKEMFTQMSILGQFNLGFIIAKLGQDLFIIDQHATDEKYNFEDLQKNTVIKSQRLIQPQSLELTAANECILMDNVDIFRKNGFDFVIDEEAPGSERVKLTSMPVSHNWTFGKDDIEELIFMLSDSPGVLCRPSRIRDMFASRACRKSIMIGTALNKHQMRKLVNHMSELDQPWNCPHGRPTMRHVINLDMLAD